MINVVVALALCWSMPIAPANRVEAKISVDISVRKPISRYVYGANFADWKTMQGVTQNRMGGNRLSAYNWETNASNAGNDYLYQNDGYMGESNEAGLTMRTFLQDSQKNGAAVLLTVPTAGRVSADKKGDGDVMKTPDWMNTRFHRSYAAKPGGKYVYPPDTTDKAVYQDEFVAWIERIKSSKTPVWFSLDNEPDLWASTHKEIVDKPLTYAEIIANNTEFASAIKKVAPKSLIFGPANYGWQGFRTFQDASDGKGRDFLDVYLAAMKDAERTHKRRLLDVLDIHWYPEAQGDGERIAFGEGKPGTHAARIQAPRSLWDPTYVETSWIADVLGKKPIVLLPRVSAQIAKHYPGTKFGITEYNYGGGRVISGALAQADVLGLFGRYGLFAANVFGMGPEDKGQIAGFRAFVNFDGSGSKFGDLGLNVTGETPAEDSVYAALDSANPGRLTIVAVNKTKRDRPFRIAVNGFVARKIRAFAATSESLPGSKAVTATLQNGVVVVSAPAESIITLELLR